MFRFLPNISRVSWHPKCALISFYFLASCIPDIVSFSLNTQTHFLLSIKHIYICHALSKDWLCVLHMRLDHGVLENEIFTKLNSYIGIGDILKC